MKKEQLLELLHQMTLEEKIGQMVQIRGEDFLEEDITVFTGPNREESQVEERLKYNVGSILNGTGAERVKRIQKSYLERNRLKIPLLFMTDIVNGYKTIFPPPLAQGCSWNVESIRKITEITKKESILAGVNVTFTPMVDLVRDARWGRCIESIGGEDPFLAKKYSEIIVQECQKVVKDNRKEEIACIKHFAAYGAVEAGREYNTVDLSERELMEYYMQGYKSAIDAGAKMIMTSFNIVNGIPSTLNKWLLKEILREKWGFEGVIITDYEGMQECINHGVAADEKEAAYKALEAGVDIEMMSTCYAKSLELLLKENRISISQIDEAVLRILNLKNELGLFENPYGFADEELEKKYVLCDQNLKEATKLTEETFVLLKNENNTLPIKKNKKICLIGPYANSRQISSSWSSYVEEESTRTLKEVWEKRMGSDNFFYSKGCEVLEKQELENLIEIQLPYVQEKNNKQYEQANIQEAVENAKKSDVIVLAIGEHYLQTGEACSRSNLEIPQIQMGLLEELYKLKIPIVVVLFNGRPLEVKNIEKRADAILEVWMPGTQGAEAIFNVLYGNTNPSGKLTMSFPQSVGQCPIYYNHYNTGRPEITGIRYESRYLDIPTSSYYPFGYGLSYSKFVYSDLKLSSKKLSRNSKITVTVKVRNDSAIPGKEVIQLYLQDLVGSVVRPVKELKGFQKEYFTPWEEKEITFEITEEMLKFWNEKLEYGAESGMFKVFVGTNSKDTMEEIFEYRQEDE